MVAWALRDRLTISWVGVAVAAILLCAAIYLEAMRTVGPLPLTYLVLAAGGARPALFTSRTDISYGFYVFAFPVQQLLANAGVQRWGITAFIALSIAGTLPLALGSWFLVERPGMRLRAGRPVVASGAEVATQPA